MMTFLISVLFVLAPPPTAWAAGDCDGLYFGVRGNVQNFKTALPCYERDQDFFMQAFMYLNGDGVPRDLKKAQARLTELKELNQFEDLDQMSLQQKINDAVEAQKQNKPTVHYDLCKDVAGTTFMMQRCAGIERDRQDDKTKAQFKDVEAKLKGGAAEKLHALVRAENTFKQAERTFRGDQFRDGSIRSQMEASIEEQMTADFTKDVVASIDLAKVPIRDAAELQASDKKLNDLYGRLAKTNDREGRALLKTSQRDWIAYRDAWTDFVKAQHAGEKPADVLERSIQTWITDKRAAEIDELLHPHP